MDHKLVPTINSNAFDGLHELKSLAFYSLLCGASQFARRKTIDRKNLMQFLELSYFFRDKYNLLRY